MDISTSDGSFLLPTCGKNWKLGTTKGSARTAYLRESARQHSLIFTAGSAGRRGPAQKFQLCTVDYSSGGNMVCDLCFGVATVYSAWPKLRSRPAHAAHLSRGEPPFA